MTVSVRGIDGAHPIRFVGIDEIFTEVCLRSFREVGAPSELDFVCPEAALGQWQAIMIGTPLQVISTVVDDVRIHEPTTLGF